MLSSVKGLSDCREASFRSNKFSLPKRPTHQIAPYFCINSIHPLVFRCAVPGLASDRYRIQNDTHAAIVNISIPFHDGQWDKCHVFSDVTANNLSHTKGDVGNSSQSTCNKWVFDHSTFESTIATDVRLLSLQGSCFFFQCPSHRTDGPQTGRWVFLFFCFFPLSVTLGFVLTLC